MSLDKKARKIILDRDNNKCLLCKCSNNLEIHHIIFKEYNGEDDFYNLVTLCKKCHREENHMRLKEKIILFNNYTKKFKKPENWENLIEKDNLVLIRITEESRDRIKSLADSKGLKMITVLEYILAGKISIKEL